MLDSGKPTMTLTAPAMALPTLHTLRRRADDGGLHLSPALKWLVIAVIVFLFVVSVLSTWRCMAVRKKLKSMGVR